MPSAVQCQVSVLAIIVATTAVSLLSSFAGGLVLYLKAVEALEDDVRATSEGDVHELRTSILRVYEKTEGFMHDIRAFTSSADGIHNNNQQTWSDTLRALFFSYVKSSEMLYFIGAELHPYNPLSNDTVFYATVWVDQDKDQENQYTFAETGNYMNETLWGENEGSLTVSCRTHMLTVDGGYVGEYLYDYLRNRDFTEFMNADPRNGVGPDLFEGRPKGDVVGAAASSWVPYDKWFTPSGGVYAYTFVYAVFVPPPPPHPWSSFRAAALLIGFNYEVLEPIFKKFKESRRDTTAVLVDRESRVVYASTTQFQMVPDWCQPQVGVSGIISRQSDCYLKIDDFGPGNEDLTETMRDLYVDSADIEFGVFAQRSLNGREHFIRRTAVRGTMELLWIRPVASVEGKMNDALIALLLFTALVLIIDIIISVLEVIYIALPLRKIAKSIESMGVLKVEASLAHLRDLEEANVGVREIYSLVGHLVVALRNMTEYRTVLPEALFLEKRLRRFSAVNLAQPPPGVVSRQAAIVFTDIEGSTEMWAAHHDDMRVALKRHNDVLEASILSNRGYKVKTIGDAFMVAFHSLDSAVRFAVDAQITMPTITYPAPLLAHPMCCQDCVGNWYGFRLKVGVNYGNIDLEKNQEKGSIPRYDYYGPTVNRAARLEALSVVGTIALSDACLAMLVNSSILSEIEVVRLGEVTLKGVPEGVAVSLLIPARMRNRVQMMRTRAQNGVLFGSPVASAAPSLSASTSSMSTLSSSQYRSTSPHSKALRFKEILTTRESTTVAHLHLLWSEAPGGSCSMTSGINLALQRMMSCVERSSGGVVAVVAESVVVGWNLVRVCGTHFDSSLRFLGEMRALKQTSEETFDQENTRHVSVGTAHCGLATGKTHVGYIGTSGMRYVTAVGGPIRESTRLLHKAALYEAAVLYCAPGEGPLVSLCEGLYARPLCSTVIAGKVRMVHELNVRKLSQRYTTEGAAELWEAPSVGGGGSGANVPGDSVEFDIASHSAGEFTVDYLQAFRARDKTALVQIAMSDKVVANVLDDAEHWGEDTGGVRC